MEHLLRAAKDKERRPVAAPVAEVVPEPPPQAAPDSEAESLPKVPRRVKGKDGDFVSFLAHHPKTRKTLDYLNQNCYANLGLTMAEWEVICRPNLVSKGKRDKPSTLSFEEFSEIFDRLKAAGHVHSGAETFRDGEGNCLYLPPAPSYAHMYTALCAYRWTDSSAPRMWQWLTLVRQYPEVPLEAIWIRVLSDPMVADGHSMLSLHVGPYSCQGWRNPLKPLVMRHLFRNYQDYYKQAQVGYDGWMANVIDKKISGICQALGWTPWLQSRGELLGPAMSTLIREEQLDPKALVPLLEPFEKYQEPKRRF